MFQYILVICITLLQRFFPASMFWRHRCDHGIVGLALSRDAVVVLGGEELQQPLLGYLIGVLIRERL